MTREEKKRYLNRYHEAKREIDMLTEEYHFWEETNKSVPVSRIEPSGVHGMRTARMPTRHLDICIKIKQLQEQAAVLLQEVVSAIKRVDDPEQRIVLELRHVGGKYFYEIAKKMDYSLQHIYRLYANALDSVEI